MKSIWDIDLLPVAGTIVGLAAGVIVNVSGGRPMYSRIPFLAMYCGIGLLSATSLEIFLENRRITKEKYILEYIRQHPEHFPVQKPAKYKDIIQPWIPNR